MKPQLTVVKLGGTIIDNEDLLKIFLSQFASIRGTKILVHGGGKIATAIGKQFGIAPVMIEGRRVTDAETLQLVTMVYAGLLNKKIAASLQSFNCNAIGLSGADGNLIAAKKRNPTPIDYGFVGDPDKVNSALLTHLLQENYVPVVSPITHDGTGQLLNTNADTIAEAISSALCKVYTTHLIFAFEKNGVLEDVSDDHSQFTHLHHRDLEQMKSSGIIHSGMLPKLESGYNALRNGVHKATIGNGLQLTSVLAKTTFSTQLSL